MPTDRIAIVFEPKIPVVNQILILQAIDFLYSAEVLGTYGWRPDATNVPDWRNRIVSLPGKFIADEHVLRVESAHSSEVTEVVEGAAGPVEKLIEFLGLYFQKKRAGEFSLAENKVAFVRTQLLPTIKGLENAGASERQLQDLLNKAVLYVDDVLAELMSQQKLRIGPP